MTRSGWLWGTAGWMQQQLELIGMQFSQLLQMVSGLLLFKVSLRRHIYISAQNLGEIYKIQYCDDLQIDFYYLIFVMFARKPLAMPYCPIHINNVEQVQHICMQAACTNQPLLCISCYKQDIHKGHETLPIGKLSQEVENMNYDQSILQQSLSLESLRKDLQTQSLAQIYKLKDKIIQEINNVQSKIIDFFGQTDIQQKQALNEYKAAYKLLPELNWDQPFAAIEEEIKEIRKVCLNRKECDTKTSNKLSWLKNVVKQQIRKFDDVIQTIDQTPIIKLKTIQLNLDQIETNFVLKWSAKFKHKDLLISQKTLKRESQQKGAAVCCLGDWEMAKGSKVFHWSINIKRNLEYFYIGMCQLEPVAQHNFEEWNWDNIRHGQYLISRNGYIYSDSDKSVNATQKTIEFNEGSLINIQFDTNKGRLTFKSDKKEFAMDVETGHIYRVVAYLYGIGSQVELIK